MLIAPHTLRFGIGFEKCNTLSIAAGKCKIIDGFSVDGKNAAGRAIFRSHVSDSGAIGEWQMIQSFTKEFHEFTDHTFFTQHIGNSEHKIGGSGAFAEFAHKLKSYYFGNEHG